MRSESEVESGSIEGGNGSVEGGDGSTESEDSKSEPSDEPEVTAKSEPTSEGSKSDRDPMKVDAKARKSSMDSGVGEWDRLYMDGKRADNGVGIATRRRSTRIFLARK